jgi:hypothetical protein
MVALPSVPMARATRSCSACLRSRTSTCRACRSYWRIMVMTSRISVSTRCSDRPSVTWLEIWYRSPDARLPSP